ncbi:MAG TPA: hypothetical protein PK514_07010 [Spirochaetota bacterium]|nr:hypothetical protein [Spirochaetota bacterium]
MEKTYRCSKGHKFKREVAASVTCPTCNEPAELMKWNTVDEFGDSSKRSILMDEFRSVVGELKNKKK